MTIAITGATSMLGVATIKRCIKNNISILAFVRKNSSRINRLPESTLVRIVECDLPEMTDFDIMGLTADIFIHFGWGFTDKAGRNDAFKQVQNIQFTLDAVYLAKKLGCRKFIGAGSQAEYGTPNCLLKADTLINPLNSYGIAKYAAGRLSYLECKKLGLEYNWVRVVSVFGEHENEGALIRELVYNAKNNIPMKLSPCEQIWDYLYEDDAGSAFVAVAQNGVDGKVYLLGSGEGRPLAEYIQEVISLVNPKYKPEYNKLPYNQTTPMYLVADISELKNDTGWSPEITFRKGVQAIINDSNNYSVC